METKSIGSTIEKIKKVALITHDVKKVNKKTEKYPKIKRGKNDGKDNIEF